MWDAEVELFSISWWHFLFCFLIASQSTSVSEFFPEETERGWRFKKKNRRGSQQKMGKWIYWALPIMQIPTLAWKVSEVLITLKAATTSSEWVVGVLKSEKQSGCRLDPQFSGNGPLSFLPWSLCLSGSCLRVLLLMVFMATYPSLSSFWPSLAFV